MPNGLMNEGAKKMHTMTTTNQIHYTCSESRLCSDSHNIIHQSSSQFSIRSTIKCNLMRQSYLLISTQYFFCLCATTPKSTFGVLHFPPFQRTTLCQHKLCSEMAQSFKLTYMFLNGDKCSHQSKSILSFSQHNSRTKRRQ